MISQNWKEQQNNWGIEKAYREAVRTGAKAYAYDIVIANPTFDWTTLKTTIEKEEEQTRLNVYFDEVDPPQTV